MIEAKDSFTYKLVCVDDKFSKTSCFSQRKNAVHKLSGAILKEYDYCKQIIKQHFDKNLIMSVQDKKIFQSSNKCWICNKLFTDKDKKVRDHDYITGKYGGSTHSNYNINLILTKSSCNIS